MKFCETIPQRMAEALTRYIEYGIQPGDFLCAVLENDFAAAVNLADNENVTLLPAYIRILTFDLPHAAWHDRASRIAWQKDGGLLGRKVAAEKLREVTP